MLAFKRTDVRFEPGFPPREAHRVIGRRAGAAHPGRRDHPRGHAGMSAALGASRAWWRRLRAHGLRALPGQGPGRRWPAGRSWRCCSSAWPPPAAWTAWPSPPPPARENDALAARGRGSWASRVFRGDEDDVLRRHLDCARAPGRRPRGARHRRQPAHRPRDAGARWSSATWSEARTTPTCPGDALLMGILSEVISRRALERSWERGEARHRSELVTLYIKEHPARVPHRDRGRCPRASTARSTG